MKIGIFVVAFNNSVFTERQIISLKKYIRNNFDLVYIDNSTIETDIENVCKRYNVHYEKNEFNFDSSNPSYHHSHSLNYLYIKYKNYFDYFVFLDHDIFLMDYLDFNNYKNNFTGVHQERFNQGYLWPGCLYVNGRPDLDFTPCPGFDTGGRLKDIIKNVKYIDELKYKNQHFNKSYYDFYSIIDNKWFHFVNGSNWNNSNNHQERLDSLFAIYDSLVK